jgi:hypothetical protein
LYKFFQNIKIVIKQLKYELANLDYAEDQDDLIDRMIGFVNATDSVTEGKDE